jgi:phosphohistidine phosphatase
MIGHNPGLHGLALMLTGKGDAKSISRLEDKFPTAALALFTFPETNWRDVGPASGRLEAFITPRDRL